MADNEAPPQNQNQIDQYQLVNCIATGGISQIWEVKHIANQQTYAMKLLLPEHIKDKELKAELKSEAAIAKELEHPNIVRVMEVSIGRDNAYFIMEHFRGGNLKGMIRNDNITAQARAKKIMDTCAQTFAFIHDKGWVHKDIKPDNILVSKAGDIRIIDFSLAAKPTGFLAKMLTKKSSVVIQGTRTYLAPELIQRMPLTFSADIYSLGILFYELLTGRPPFIFSNPNDLLMAHVREQAEKPSSFNPNLTPELDQFIFKMIAKKPKERFATMHDVFAALRTLKVFKEEPESYLRNKAASDQSKFENSMAHSLDSRSDATRTPEERKKAAEEARKTKEAIYGKRKSTLKEEPSKAKGKPAAPAPQPQPMAMQPMMPAPMPYPQMPMGYPGYPQMPGMPMGMPGMPMPGMPMPGMMPGQVPMPGMFPGGPMPGMPGGGMPSAGIPMPGMPMPAPGAMPQPMGAPGAPRPLAPAPVAGPGQMPPAAVPAPIPPAPKPVAPVSKPPVEDIPLASIDDLMIE